MGKVVSAVASIASIATVFVPPPFNFIAAFGLNLLSAALAPKPKSPSLPNRQDKGITRLVRASVEPRRVIYGERMVSGPLVYATTTGAGSRFLHLVVALAGHEVEAIGTVFLNDVAIEDSDLDGSGTAISGRFAGKARIKKHLGADAQLADADLVAEVADWTTNHRLRGVAYLYLRLDFDRDTFPTGIPNIKAQVKGRKLFDPRDLSTIWSDNAALAVRDYLVSTFGLSADPTTELDDASIITAANISDEDVALSSSLPTFDFTADALTDTLTQTVAGGGKPKPLHLGDRVAFTTVGTLPGGIDGAGPYYAIPVTDTTFKVAASLAGARAGTAIDVTSAGSGTHTARRTHQPRYTVNGVVQLDQRPVDVVTDFTHALGGALVYTQGKYVLHAGAFTGPATVGLTESDLRGEIKIRPRPGKRELHNAVRGTFTDRDNAWQPTEFPPVTNAAYEANDGGERIFKDVELRHVTDVHRAQRLAKLTNERDRQGLIVDFPAKLTALEIAVMDTITLDLKRGADQIFSNKEFEVVGWTLAEDGGIDLTLKETAAAVYAWDPDADETVVDPAPNTSLPRAFDAPAPPTNLALTSGSAELLLAGDGTVIGRLHVAWTAPDDIFVTSGGRIEVQAKKSADADWTPQPSVDGADTFAFVGPIDDGVSWDVRVRSVNQVGVTSAWVTVSGHVVVGKTAAPADVASFSAAQNGDVVNFKWGQVADVDVAGYEIRFATRGAFVWADATPVTQVTRGTAITNAQVPPGDWTFGIKAVDTSGNESAAAKTANAVVVSTFDVILEAEQAPSWANIGQGSGTGFVEHYTGVLVPDSQDLASVGGWETFDRFVPNPVAQASYEAPEQDAGFDDTVRVFADIASGLGPGETTGTADPDYQIDHRKAAGAYDGFEPWTIGNVEARFVKQRIVLNTADGVARITGFKPAVDLKERSEGAEDVTVAAGGSAIAFAKTFHGKPTVKVVADGAAARIATKESVTTTGFTAHVFNTGGSDVGGTIDWEATGV